MFGKKVQRPGLTLADRVQRIAQSGPTPAAAADARASGRAARAPAFRPATLVCIGGERIDAVLKNVSATGARIDCPRAPNLPERVQLITPSNGLRKWAYVTWQTWGAAGLEFVEPDVAD